MKSVQVRSFFWSVFSRIWTDAENAGKYSPEKTPYLDIFHGVSDIVNGSDNAKYLRERYAVLKQVLEHFIKRFFKEYVNSLHE